MIPYLQGRVHKGDLITTIQDKKCYVGIDVSKAQLDVFISSFNKYMQFENNEVGDIAGIGEIFATGLLVELSELGQLR